MLQMAVYPGQVLPLGLVGLDQFEHATYFIARVSDRRTDINSGAFSQATEEDSNATVSLTSCTIHVYLHIVHVHVFK